MKVHISINFLVIVLLMGLVACREVPPTASPSQTPTAKPTATRRPSPVPSPTPVIVQGTVTIWHSWDESLMPALVQIITAFQAQYPDILFDVLYIPLENLQTRYEIAVQEGIGPSVLFGPAAWGIPLYDKGLAADLVDLVDGNIQAMLNPAAKGNGQYGDTWIGLPYTLRGVVLYRNSQLVQKAPATFDELVNLAKQITHGEIIGADLERSFFFSGGHLFGLGGQLIQPDGNPAFNDDIGLVWIELLRNFSQAGPTEFQSDRDLELFKSGRVGFIIDGTWNMTVLAAALGPANLAIDPWPSYEAGYLAGFVQAENIYLNSKLQSDRKLAAQSFMKFMLSDEAQKILAENGMIPAVAEVSALKSQTGAMIEQAMKALAGGSAYPPLPQMAVYGAPLDIAIKSVLLDKAPPGDALQSAAQAIQKALANLEATSPPAPIQTPTSAVTTKP